MKALKTIRIGGTSVGEGQPVFIIAEAGVNHNGSIALAKKLVDAARAAGADAVKFQTFDSEELATSSAKMAKHQKNKSGTSEAQVKFLKRLELSDKEFAVLAAYAKKKGITFLSTPHGGFSSVDLLQKLKVPAFKFGSGDCNNLPVLAYAAKLKKPMIISTGMADERGVKEAVECIRKAGNNDIVVFQCTTDYPAKPEEINLLAMPAMGKKFKVIVGYSDHTQGADASIAAVALGARVLEKHLTLSNDMEGPDHKASMDIKHFAGYVRSIRETEAMMGSPKKTIAKSSKHYIPLILKSVVVRGNVKKGEQFTEKNLAIKRPASGLPPKFYFAILGKRATRNIGHDEFIRKSDYTK